MQADVPALVTGTLVGIVVSSLFVMFLLVGFSLVLGFPKLRKSGGKTLIVRGLDEALGGTAEFLPPTAPRGPADQLDTPELQEKKRQKSAAA
jgi:hypothetical protein